MTSTNTDGAPAGVSQLIVVSSTVTTLVAPTPPNVTRFAPAPGAVNPVPVITIGVAPAEAPLGGATAETVGAVV